jgi:hypothetical protein
VAVFAVGLSAENGETMCRAVFAVGFVVENGETMCRAVLRLILQLRMW